jgi:hypothetical protein
MNHLVRIVLVLLGASPAVSLSDQTSFTYVVDGAENPVPQIWTELREGMTRSKVWSLLGSPGSVDKKDRSDSWTGPLVRKPEPEEPPTYYGLRVVYDRDLKVVKINPHLITDIFFKERKMPNQSSTAQRP